MWRRRLLPGICLITLGGCASIVSGPDQEVAVTTDPPGATVQVGDQVIQSPGTLTLKRKDSCSVRVSQDGYYDNYARLQAGENPWLLGNIVWDLPTTALFLTISQGMCGFHVVGPGSIYDRMTGAGYELVPGKVAVTLERRPTTGSEEESSLPAPARLPHIIKEIALPEPASEVISEAGSLWVFHGRHLSRIDPQTNEVAETLPQPGGPLHHMDADSLWFVRHRTLGTFDLCKFDRHSQQVTALVPLPRDANMLRFGEGAFWALEVPRGWGSAHQPLEVLKIDPQSAAVVSRIPVSTKDWPLNHGVMSQAVTLTAGLGSIWLTRGNVLVRIDARSNEILATIPLEREPCWAAAGDDALWLFSGRTFHDEQTEPERVTRIDPVTNSAGRAVPYPGKTQALAVGPNAIWYINGDERIRTLQWLDARTGEVAKESLPLGENLHGSAGSHLMASHQGDLWVVPGNSLLRIATE